MKFVRKRAISYIQNTPAVKIHLNFPSYEPNGHTDHRSLNCQDSGNIRFRPALILHIPAEAEAAQAVALIATDNSFALARKKKTHKCSSAHCKFASSQSALSFRKFEAQSMPKMVLCKPEQTRSATQARYMS